MKLPSEWETVLFWLESRRSSVRFIPKLVDLTGDLVCGLLLSQALYWFSRAENSDRPRVRISKDGRYWLAKTKNAWWEECRITPKQVTRALNILRKRRLIDVRIFKFDGAPTTHITINWAELVPAIKTASADWSLESSEGENDATAQSERPAEEVSKHPKGQIDSPERMNSLTEITPENTAQITTRAQGVAIADDVHLSSDEINGLARNTQPQDAAELASLLLKEWKAAIPGELSESDEAAGIAAAHCAIDIEYPPEAFVSRMIGLGLACKTRLTFAEFWSMAERTMQSEKVGLPFLKKRFPASDHDRRVARFLARWIAAFEMDFSRRPVFTRADIKAVDDAFQNDPELDGGELIQLAKEAWKYQGRSKAGSFDRFFWCRKASLIGKFIENSEKIRQELESV